MILFLQILIYTTIFLNIFTTIYTYKKLGTFVLTFPLWVIYYWSIYGVFFIINFKQDNQFLYLESEMFPINIDENYIYATLFYCIFLWIFNFIILFYSVFSKARAINKMNLSYIQNKYILYVLTLMLFIYISGWKEDIIIAYNTGRSLYELSRFESNLGNLYSVIQFFGDLFLCLCIITLFLAKRGGGFKQYTLFLLAIYFVIQLLLGNRNVLLTGLILYALLFIEIYGLRKILTIKNIVYLLSAYILIAFIGLVRGSNLESIWYIIISFDIDKLVNLFFIVNESSEKFSAHFSMYGVIEKDVPFTYGSSVLFLISSFIPTFLGISRFPDIYTYYADQMSFSMQKGFTINHITAWYLNFGLPGIVIGSIVWAIILVYIYNKFLKSNNFFWCIFASLFSVSSIQMIRGGGIETYKASIILTSAIPTIIIYFIYKMKKINIKFKG